MFLYLFLYLSIYFKEIPGMLFNTFFKMLIIYFERDRVNECMNRGGAERERERERIPSRFCAVSMDPTCRA